jgi:hypothetical protein
MEEVKDVFRLLLKRNHYGEAVVKGCFMKINHLFKDFLIIHYWLLSNNFDVGMFILLTNLWRKGKGE